MFASIILPETLNPEKLDIFLANGWYRMGQSIFTTHFLCFNNCFYSAIWLRVSLTDAINDATYKRLQKQNKSFTITISKAEIKAQHESLYASYRKSIDFEPSETLQSLLYGHITGNRFDTYMVTVHNEGILIGAGYFDLGQESAAGIVSFYHPEYKKYSLGKFIIYSKMNFCRSKKIKYFYPGYMVPGYSPFDYKTSIGRETLEYFSVSTQQWIAFTTFTENADPLKIMHTKLSTLQKAFTKNKIPGNILYYRFFDANLDPYYVNEQLFDFPVFLYTTPSTHESTFKVIVYDVRNEMYALIRCSSVIATDWYQNIAGIFNNHLLKYEQILYVHADPEKLAERIRTSKSK